jgi:predicted aspartyl protease
MRGQFKDDSIQVPIEVFGFSEDHRQKIEAIVDTGFSGYLTMPFVTAFPMGLILKGTQVHLLANGATSNHFVCLGTVIFEGKKVAVPIDVQESGPILMGVQLLKKLGFDLKIDFVKESFEFTKSRSKPPAGLPNVKINF